MMAVEVVVEVVVEVRRREERGGGKRDSDSDGERANEPTRGRDSGGNGEGKCLEREKKKGRRGKETRTRSVTLALPSLLARKFWQFGTLSLSFFFGPESPRLSLSLSSSLSLSVYNCFYHISLHVPYAARHKSLRNISSCSTGAALGELLYRIMSYQHLNLNPKEGSSRRAESESES